MTRPAQSSRSSSDASLRVGTSGWQYRHWRGVFYPDGLPQRDWFGFYAERFDTVEVNNTFYRLPERSTFESWERRAPRGFVYAVKGSRFITHVKRLRDPRDGLERFAERAGALRASRGPVLWQLDPRFRRDDERLDAFLAALPDGFDHAVEFRHESWLAEEVLGRLRSRSVALCVPDHPSMPRSLALTARWTYLRFHSGEAGGGYTSRQLDEWAERVTAWLVDGISVWAYFNNDWEGHAVRDARALLDRLGAPHPAVEHVPPSGAPR